jgi:hypothetical protein
MSGSDMKLPTVLASAIAPASSIDTPPSECGDASAKIRSGNSDRPRELALRLVARSRAGFRALLRLALLGFSEATAASCPGVDQAAAGAAR